MSGPYAITDRERCHQLEARVAELEAELDVWRMNDRRAGLDSDHALRVEALNRELKVVTNRRACRPVAKILLALMAQPGKLRTYLDLASATARDPEELSATSTKVLMVSVRRALQAWGLSGEISNVWGHGYVLTPAGAEALEGMLRRQA